MDMGADAVTANRFLCKLVKAKNPVSLYEVYGRGALADMATKMGDGLNVVGLRVLDLRFDNPRGVPWDSSRPDHQEMAMALVEEDDPDWIVGAPPCTDWSILNWNSNFAKMNPADVKKRLPTALSHLSLYVVSAIDKSNEANSFFTNIPLPLDPGSKNACVTL